MSFSPAMFFVVNVLVLHHTERKCNDLFLVTAQDTTGNAPQGSVVVAESPAAASCIQFCKSKFMFMCACMDVIGGSCYWAFRAVPHQDYIQPKISL